jgi:hypothetical protein
VEIQTNCKIWVWKEIQLSPQCVHTWANGTCYTSLSMKQGSLFGFVCWDLPTRVFHAALLVSLESSWWVRWFETVWSYGVEAIDYWTKFSMKIKKNKKWKLYWNLGVLVILLESPQQVRCNKVHFTIFRTKVWKILIFEWILLLEIETNWNKLGWEGKICWALNVFTLPNFRKFQILRMWKIKNVFTLGPTCVHTHATLME